MKLSVHNDLVTMEHLFSDQSSMSAAVPLQTIAPTRKKGFKVNYYFIRRLDIYTTYAVQLQLSILINIIIFIEYSLLKCRFSFVYHFASHY